MKPVETTTTSISLLEGVRAGGERAWHTFFRTYAPLVLTFARRLGLSDADANDAVQETLMSVYTTFRALDGPFDRSKGRFKAWLGGVAQHKVSDILRRRGRDRPHGHTRAVTPLDDVADAQESTRLEQLFNLEWQRHLVARAIDIVAREAPPDMFQAFELCAVQGEAPESVARLLGVSRNAVYISKTRIMQRVRQALARLMAEEE